MKRARIVALLGALLSLLALFLWWGPDFSGLQLAKRGIRIASQVQAGPPHDWSWLPIGLLFTAFALIPSISSIGVIRALHDGRVRALRVHGALLIGWYLLFGLFEPRPELGYGIGLLISLVAALPTGVSALWVARSLSRSQAATRATERTNLQAAEKTAAVQTAKSAATTAWLEMCDLDVHYGAVHALKGVSLEVKEGEIVALLGSNGAGKTTTLRALSGLCAPSRGSIWFRGQEISGRSPDSIVALGVAHAPEGRGIFANLSVRENLDLGAYQRHDRAAIADDFERSLSLFPRLRERLSQRAGTLSGGEQQMLAIGRAIMARPKLLLLDEPSLGLAPQITKVIFQIIRDINKNGTTILLVEQNANLALKIAHKGYVLETGTIVMQDSAANLAASDEVRRAYLGGH